MSDEWLNDTALVDALLGKFAMLRTPEPVTRENLADVLERLLQTNARFSAREPTVRQLAKTVALATDLSNALLEG